MKSLRWIVLTVMTCVLASCQTPTVSEAKVEANQKWLRTRAQMQYNVAQDYLKAGQLDKAKAKVTEALSLDPEYPDARVLLAKVQIGEGQYTSAARELERVCLKVPTLPTPFYLLGVAQERDGKLEEALGSYQKALALDNTSVPAVLGIAEVLVAMGRVQDAQSHVESYMSIGADDAGMQEMAGRLAMLLKQYDKAAASFQQARDLDVKNMLYVEALARAQFLAGKYADAAESLRTLMSVKDRKVAQWMHTMLGDCYVTLNRLYEARDQYQQVTEMSPKDAEAWTNLAKAAMKLGDSARGALAAQQALQLDSTNLDATLTLGYCLLGRGQYKQAQTVLKRACTAHPDSALLWCVLGRAHAAGGNNEEAAKCYSAALQIQPDSQVARELLNAATAKKVSLAN